MPEDELEEVPGEASEAPDDPGSEGAMPGCDVRSGKEGDIGPGCICTSAGGCGSCDIGCACAKAAWDTMPNAISKRFEAIISEIS
ncbi:hypothetical protein GCM10027343_31560 [Noviherbaspirillum agri]